MTDDEPLTLGSQDIEVGHMISDDLEDQIKKQQKMNDSNENPEKECEYCGSEVVEDHDLINKEVHTDCQDVPNDTPACSGECAYKLLGQFFRGVL